MEKMIKLIKNADLYAPEHVGLRDILICGGKIAKIAEDIEGFDGLSEVDVFDAMGMAVAPGLIDIHVHVTGGGGEQGPSSRVPEITLSQLLTNGVTTCVGLLGTDGITRSLENLLAKCKALNEEGMTCYMLTGSYQYPTQTITGSVIKDIALIDEIIGTKVAISDHRASNLTCDELIRLASDTRMGGLISGKAGMLCMHMGSGANMLNDVFYAIENTEIPIKTFVPTHMGRNIPLVSQGIKLAEMGGNIDITASDPAISDKPASEMIAYCLRNGASAERITISSDGCGSMPRFNEKGECIGLDYTSPKVLLIELKNCVFKEGIPLETALMFLTSNPARVIGKQGVKGAICEGADADIVILNEDLDIVHVIAKGEHAFNEGQALLKGRFEK
ncbi:MAG: beta-aspartyl-peptidase [Clostridiaceae bacterium]|nr:beta-aspartyl-peptidase [Clostridiaceae bacterium]